jgi:Fe-S cluster assembly iron-binding protein IscA
MALDEPKETDEVIKEKGVTFLIDKQLLAEVQPVTIDFVETQMGAGFKVSSAAAGAGGCGSNTCSC